MPSTVEQLSPTRVKITVEVPFSDLQPSLDKAYREIAKSVNIPGFRKGKVPALVIDQRFGRGVVIQEAFNDSWQRFYGAAVTENQLSPLDQPELEVTRLEDGDRIEFTAEVDIRPDFTLPDFGTLSATVEAVEVSEGLVDGQIDMLRNRFAARETVDRPAADGDLVTLDLVAARDGESLPDATAQDLEYTIGSGTMLDGLDDAVTGLSAGESATFASTLVGGELANQEAEVTATVTSVQRVELPEVDDEFAGTASEFDTVDEMRDNIRERLTAMARLEQAAEARDAVLEALVDSLDIEVPETVFERELQGRREQIGNQLAQAGLTLEQYLADAEEGKDADEFWDDVRTRSEQALKAQLVLDKVADDRSLGVDQNDLTQHIVRRAQADGVPPQQVADHLQEHPHHIDEYLLEIRRGKALALIVESANVTDSHGQRVDLAALREDGTLAADADADADAASAATEEPAAQAEVGAPGADTEAEVAPDSDSDPAAR